MGKKKCMSLSFVSSMFLLFLLGIACLVYILHGCLNPYYAININAEIEKEVHLEAFRGYYPCLEYTDGLLIHGKDTFDVYKFTISDNEKSWHSLSNAIYNSECYRYIDNKILPEAKYYVPPAIHKLMNHNEVICSEFKRGCTYLYLSKVCGRIKYLYIFNLDSHALRKMVIESSNFR